MNSTFNAKFLQHIAANKKNNEGFTLIELLVVVIIIGVLAAIALPNLLGQVARGREAEAENNLGAVNRAQQTFRLDNGTFSADITAADFPVKVSGEYYTYSSDSADANGAAHSATATSTWTNDITDFASAVGQTSDGTASAVICQAPDPATAVTATAGTAAAKATC